MREQTCSVAFIYSAARMTPDVATPSGGMTHYDPAPLGEMAGTCWLCGCPTRHGHPRKRVIKPTFTDGNRARAPWSDVVCEHCAWALSYKSLLNYSILATKEGLLHPSRAEVREVLLNPPEPPFVLCAATSGQRWLHFKGAIAHSKARFGVRFEDVPVWVAPESFRALLESIEELYTAFTKAEIESGNYQVHRILRFGMKRWEELIERVAPHRKSGPFKLALFVAQREEQANGKEDEGGCTTDSIPATKTLL